MSTRRLTVIPEDFGLHYFRNEPLTKRGKERGYSYCKQKYVHNIFFVAGEQDLAIKARCFRSMRKNESPHSLNMVLEGDTITCSHCTCVAGQSGTCSHLIGLVDTICDYQKQGLQEVPDQLSSTSVAQEWHKPRGAKIKPQPVTEMVLAKPYKDSRKRRPILTSVTEQRVILPSSDEIQVLKSTPNIPLSYLLSEDAQIEETPYGNVQKGSSLFYHLKHIQEQDPPQDEVACGNTQFPLPTSLALPTEYCSVNTYCPITQAEAEALEQATVTQSACSHWFASRKNRLTASKFGDVLKRKKDVNEKFLNRLFNSKAFETESTRYGLNHEGEAKKAYLTRNPNKHLHDCGLVVHPSFSCLGASPDAKVCEGDITGILEVKCPFTARNMNIVQAVDSLKSKFCLHLQDEHISLKTTHDYHQQVQGQLMITGAPFCDFVLFTSKDIHIERILPDLALHQDMLTKLVRFYHDHAMPYITNMSQ